MDGWHMPAMCTRWWWFRYEISFYIFWRYSQSKSASNCFYSQILNVLFFYFYLLDEGHRYFNNKSSRIGHKNCWRSQSLCNEVRTYGFNYILITLLLKNAKLVDFLYGMKIQLWHAEFKCFPIQIFLTSSQSIQNVCH